MASVVKRDAIARGVVGRQKIDNLGASLGIALVMLGPEVAGTLLALGVAGNTFICQARGAA